MMTSDFHMHTSFSTDCDVPPREMIQAAITKGLECICITDHNDKDFPKPELYDEAEPFVFDADVYFAELTKLKTEFQKQIDIRIGVEIGMQEHLVSYYQNFVTEKPYDFVIASMHVIHRKDPYYPEYFDGMTDEEAYRDVFRETVRMLDLYEDFDVLGHLDYIVRYGREREKAYSYQKYADEIDTILKRLIEKGKGLELNSAGFKYQLGFAHPHPDVLQRYRELGGEIITVGADGHKPEHIAYDFQYVAEILKKCGFKYYTEFKNREPIFQQLP